MFFAASAGGSGAQAGGLRLRLDRGWGGVETTEMANWEGPENGQPTRNDLSMRVL
jgi:hypothetical protein